MFFSVSLSLCLSPYSHLLLDLSPPVSLFCVEKKDEGVTLKP
jgi:hypothetical protein